MIPVTNEPMEGEVFNVQDHARRTGTTWTGTHGEMISSDLHGAEEPIRWLLGPIRGAETGQCLTELLHQRRRGCSINDTLDDPGLGGLTHFRWNVSLGWPKTSPRSH
jgi:hypothetical protein